MEASAGECRCVGAQAKKQEVDRGSLSNIEPEARYKGTLRGMIKLLAVVLLSMKQDKK